MKPKIVRGKRCALFTVVSTSIIASSLFMIFANTFLQKSFLSLGPSFTSISGVELEQSKFFTKPHTTTHNNESVSFKPIGEGSVKLVLPKVVYSKIMSKAVSKVNLYNEIPIPKPHPIIPVGPHTKGNQIPYTGGSIFPINQNIILYHFTNVTFTSETVIISDNNYNLFTKSCHPRYWDMFYRSPSSVTYTFNIYESAICLGHQHSSDFGHWFLEVFPAYAIIPKDILQKSVVVVPFIRKHVIEGFNFLGVSKEQIVEGDNIVLHANNYYTMDYTFCGDLNRFLIANLRELFIKRFGLGKNPPTEYLTFNRPNMSRCMKNYDEVRNALKEKWPNIDWKDGIYHKTLAEQAAYFDKVKFVFVVHGSVLANIIFMQPNTAIVDLQMEQWLLSFLWLSTYTGKYMVVGRDPRISWRGLTPNVININYVLELVEKAFKTAGYI